MSVDDDPYVPAFSMLVVVWAICFVQLWRRRQLSLSFAWGSTAADDTQRLRPSFVGVAATDPVTGRPTLVDPAWRRCARYAISACISLGCLLVPVGAMFASLNLQGYIQPNAKHVLGCRVHSPWLAAHAAPGGYFDPAGSLALVPVVLHAIVINLLNLSYRVRPLERARPCTCILPVRCKGILSCARHGHRMRPLMRMARALHAHRYRSVARRLTALENHRTQAAHDRSLLIKRFAFEACDAYIALFYIAFELQDVLRLRQELIALYTTDTLRRVLLETLLPLASNWRAARASNRAALHATADEPSSPDGRLSARTAAAASARTAALASELALEPYEDFDDYLEMVIQFGYVTLFASAFPRAAALSLACNLLELLADSFKLVALCRRPRPVRSASIGGWLVCLYVLMLASIYTNIFIGCIASDQLAAILPSLFTVEDKGLFAAYAPGGHDLKEGMGRYVVLLAVGVEHALLGLLLLSEYALARPPAWVRLVMARRDVEQREASRGPSTVGDVRKALRID